MTVWHVGRWSARGWLTVAWMVCAVCGCVPPVDSPHSLSRITGTTCVQDLPDERFEVTEVSPDREAEDFAAVVRSLQERQLAMEARGTEPAETGDQPVRWAILGTSGTQDAGLTDLLHDRLASLDCVQLVEREQWQAIAAEYSLDAFGAAGAVRQRLLLGTVLQADRLLLLSRIALSGPASETTDVFRLVIADCGTGARIGHENYPADISPEDFLDAAAAAVEQVGRRFPAGVKQVVGVSHFVSQNLVHHYDHRQAGYGYLLQHALALHPGTAVLEIEEARAIAQELSFGAPDQTAALRRRAVPVLVDGEFTVAAQPTASPTAVDLTVFVRRGNGVEEIRKTALAPADVVALLTGELARRILELDSEEPVLFSPAEQRDWLSARAEQFGRVGAWDHSIGLREAALLIDPDDVPLRLALLSEYSLQMSRPLPVPLRPEQVPTEEEFREMCRERVAAFFARLEHLEFLVRNRKVRADELLASQSTNGSLVFGVRTIPNFGSFHWFSTQRLYRSMPAKIVFDVYAPKDAERAQQFIRTTAREEYAVADERHADFMKSLFPRIVSLRCCGDREAHVAKQWVAYLLACHRPWTMARPALSAEEVDAVYRTIVEALDQGTGLGRDVQMQWAEYLLEYHERRVRVGAPSAEMLDDVFHVITGVFPRNSFLHKGLMEQLTRFVQNDMLHWDERHRLEPIGWYDAYRAAPLADFLDRLVENDQPVVQVYGRYGQLYRRWHLWQNRRRYPELRHRAREPETFATASELSDQDEKAALLAELSSLAEEAKQMVAFCTSSGIPIQSTEAFRLRYLTRSIERRLQSLTTPAREFSVWRHYTPGEEDRLARYEYTGRIGMTVTALTGQSWPVDDVRWQGLRHRWGRAYRWSIHTNWYPIVGWRKCTETLDVLWNEWAVLIMREKGVAREILSETEPRYLDVKWDGRHLWVLTQHDGLRVVSPNGQIVYRIGQRDGLPPYDRGVVMHPVQPGVAFLSGSFGEHCRGWCAIVDVRESQPVRVIHQATEVWSHVSISLRDGAARVFIPFYVHEHIGEDPGQRLLLVGQRNPQNNHASTLFVDLRTLEVQTSPWTCWARGRRPDTGFHFYSGKGRLLHAFGSDLRPGVAEWTGPSLLDHHTLTERGLCEGGGGGGYLLPLGEWIYVPEGRGYWYRIHRDTFEAQPVLREGATNHPYTGIFSISAHYGIVVTTCGDGLHHRPYSQIRIHEPR
jgi:hypothetical protein